MLLVRPRCSGTGFLVCLLSLSFLLLIYRRPPPAVTLVPPEREFDLAIFGAYGFIGTLATAAAVGYRAPFAGARQEYPLENGRILGRTLLVGRNYSKLLALKQSYASAGVDMSSVEIAVAAYGDPASLDRFVGRVRVVLNVAGTDPPPLTRDKLVMKCALAGTHYVDVTSSWMPSFTDPPIYSWAPTFTDGSYTLTPSLTMLDEASRASGAVIVLATGCSATPHQVAARAAVEALGEPVTRVSLYEVFHSGVEDVLVFAGPEWCGVATCTYNPNITLDSGKNNGYVVRKDGTNAFPTDIAGHPVSLDVHMLEDIPVQKSVMESQSFFLTWWNAKQLGWGNFSFEQLTPTNSWIAHDGNRRSEAFRRNSKFTVVAEVEGHSGRIQTATHRQYEFLYEDTMRAGFEMALTLLYEKERVLAAKTGGVALGASGWGRLLQDKLDAIGLLTEVEEPGTSAATILRNEMRKWNILAP